MKRILVMLAAMLVAVAAFALPSVEAVQSQVRQGHYAQAETMMREVVVAKPGSARAHYVYAEILAHDQHFEQARHELQLARQIAPDLGFTQPEKFRAFQQQLEDEQGAVRHAPAARSHLVAASPLQRVVGGSNGVPGWAWALGAAAMAALLWSLFTRRPQNPYTPAASAAGFGGPSAAAPVGPGSPAPGYGPGYGPTAGAPAAGSGMLGTGLAAAGGLATGMLVEKLLDSHGNPGIPGTIVPEAGSGFVPGSTGAESGQNQAADELEQRQIDFGSGDEWGGGSSDGSGADDGSGGGDDGSGSGDDW